MPKSDLARRKQMLAYFLLSLPFTLGASYEAYHCMLQHRDQVSKDLIRITANGFWFVTISCGLLAATKWKNFGTSPDAS